MRKNIDIIFDLDGTLIDSANSILESLKNALHKEKVELTKPLHASLIGPPLHAIIQSVTENVDEVKLNSVINSFKSTYDSHGYAKTIVYPGIDKVLNLLISEGVKIHIATNKRAKPTNLILTNLKWDKLFTSVYSLNSAKVPFKTKSQLLKEQLKSQNIISSKAMYIGDRSDDLISARDNELKFGWAKWGYCDPFIKEDYNFIALSKPASILQIAKIL